MLFARLTALTLLLASSICGAQTPAPTASSAQERSAALSSLFKQIWEARLKRSPEFASALGDRRYNDQLSDLSPRAINDELAQEQRWLLQLATIDTSGLPEQERISAELMERELYQHAEGAKFKEWEMPVNQFGGLHTSLPGMVDSIPLDTPKDYDDWIARLHKVPDEFRQLIGNMILGIDEGRVQPQFILELVRKQTHDLAIQTPEQSSFAQPLKKFPATIDAVTRKLITAQMLDAIQVDVLPAYVRFEKFLTAQAIPAGRKDDGIWAIPDGDAYYAFCVRRSTTLDKTPQQIHQVGLDEVARDEAEMTTLVKKLGYADITAYGAGH